MTLKNLFFLVLFAPSTLFAQRGTDMQAVTTNLYSGEAIETYDLRKVTKIKRVFFKEEWLDAQIVFIDENKKSKNFPVKYDILNQEINVSVQGSIYVLPTALIDGFILSDVLGEIAEFTIFKDENKGPTGIFEVIESGKFTFLEKHSAKRIKADYQPTLDVGSKDEKAVRKNTFYLMDDRGQFFEIPTKKKLAKELFNRYPSGKKYLAKHKVNFKNSNNLKELVILMNKN